MLRNKRPIIIGSWKLKWLSKLLQHPIYSATIPLITGLLSWLNFFLGWIDDSYRITFIIVGSVAILISLLLPFFLRLIRYDVLFAEIRDAIKQLPIDNNTYLFGAGGGSFKSIGMLLKAWEEENPNTHPPYSLCLSMVNDATGISFYPSLDDISPSIRSKLLIVLAQIGTGSTAKAVKAWADSVSSINGVEIFCLIMSETAADSGEWPGVYTLGVINRKDIKHSVLPWVSTKDEF